ncbi:hypothetical protein [Miltoncostaea marina]|uniref:hypothetical protein n=1 Tax=Miltoncostaea marina TaxID=2843215 RepID=UPI001C3C495C|nr:hypothetical protein [Miltoncostaea marina]
MDDALSAARAAAEAALGHPVPHALPARGGLPLVAASVAGDPPRARVAWIGAGGDALARIACPPGRPSRWRPVVAAVIEVELPGGVTDRVLVGRAAGEAAAARPVLAGDEPAGTVPVGAEGLVLARLPAEAAVLAVDALDASGEPIGRLARPGVSELRFDGSSLGGRMGATHGMAAGFGGGRWAAGEEDAAFEAGYEPWLPGWTPPGLERGRLRVEPDVAYPAAPPAIVTAWASPEGARMLLRQAPAPLASPDAGGRGARAVDVRGAPGVLRPRGIVTLVWETPERAFGLQLRGVPDAEATALRAARSVVPPPRPSAADR